MYRRRATDQLEFENFYLPFGGKLRSDNRWVKLAKAIPWEELEEQYASLFSKDKGAPAKTFRMALGALIIKEKLNITDEETVEQIRETPYLQYFIGLTEYKDEAPFDSSMMVHFRKRLSPKILAEINEVIVQAALRKEGDGGKGDSDSSGSPDEPSQETTGGSSENRGIMIIDASVAPADIAYPTDLNLLNEAREKLEGIIDVLYEPLKGNSAKPRTYRQRARRDYLVTAKRRKVGEKAIRKAIKKQLQYIRRDLGHITSLLNKGASLELLSRQQYRNLLVIQEVYRQQEWMYTQKMKSIEDRIVSISQPHVRPIVRGKASAEVEFGAKIMVSRIEGYHILEEISWENVNEATRLQEQIERYRERMGWYPEAVLVDKLYRNRENLRYCKERNIRLSGQKLGRPHKNEREDKKQERIDSGMRNAIEGSFGIGKRRYGLNRIMTRCRETSETSISLIVLVMNLEKLLRDIFVFIVRWYFLPLRWRYI
ncbi:MAG: IS5-like element ISLca3 family transposase [Spirochaetota bacterium]